MTPTNDESERDLLSAIEIEVACNICNATYTVPASIVRESQRLLAEGCTGESLYECDASFLATLVEPAAIADLERAWASFQQNATAHGGMRVAVVANAASPRARDLDARAVQRWENEGGCCEHARAAIADHRARAANSNVSARSATNTGLRGTAELRSDPPPRR
jgi:hypothetical protein